MLRSACSDPACGLVLTLSAIRKSPVPNKREYFGCINSIQRCKPDVHEYLSNSKHSCTLHLPSKLSRTRTFGNQSVSFVCNYWYDPGMAWKHSLGLHCSCRIYYYDAAHLLNSADATSLLNSIYVHWQLYYIVAGGWVIGHLFGYVFLGVALLRSKTIPPWSSYILIFTPILIGPLAYGLNNGWLQVAGYILILIASIPVAIRMSKTNDVALPK